MTFLNLSTRYRHSSVMTRKRTHLLIEPSAMNAADHAARDSGINMWQMMVNAGSAVAACALREYPQSVRFAVFCGPGNNGGDGYVAAHVLKQSGANVDLYQYGRAPDSGDALSARNLWHDDVRSLQAYNAEPGDTIIDALFGAGLSRPLDEELCQLIDQINKSEMPVIAADLPSGIDGRTGNLPANSSKEARALKAAHTVTFMCRKPGHVLLPGKEACGVVEVFDIGIPERILLEKQQNMHINTPDLWSTQMPAGSPETHKYSIGHLCVFSGPANATGAARLSANAGLRAGAGVVTLLAPKQAMETNAAHLTAIMLKEATAATIDALKSDRRMTAFVLGPGYGLGEETRRRALDLAGKPLILDADGISAFAENSSELFDTLKSHETSCIMTPHEGEFARLFPDLAADRTMSKIDLARTAAKRANAIIVYKGSDTVIAAPDSRVAVNINAPAWLATAGSGDVLAGIAGGLLAQGTPPFEAACAAVWLHGKAGTHAGQGLTAETLIEAIRPYPAP